MQISSSQEILSSYPNKENPLVLSYLLTTSFEEDLTTTTGAPFTEKTLYLGFFSTKKESNRIVKKFTPTIILSVASKEDAILSWKGFIKLLERGK